MNKVNTEQFVRLFILMFQFALKENKRKYSFDLEQYTISKSIQFNDSYHFQSLFLMLLLNVNTNRIKIYNFPGVSHFFLLFCILFCRFCSCALILHQIITTIRIKLIKFLYSFPPTIPYTKSKPFRLQFRKHSK